MRTEEKLALKASFKLSVDTNLEFIKERTQKGPLFVFMALARRDAIDALVSLASVDPKDHEAVRKLQNEVQRFIDTLGFIRTVLTRGDEAAEQLNEEEQDELRDIVAAEGGEIPGDDA